MMRNAYRSYDPLSNQYIHVAFIDFVNHTVEGLPINTQEHEDWVTIHTLAFLEQCTGVKDCVGHDIYIGDIIQLQLRQEDERQFYGLIGYREPHSLCWFPDSFAAKIRQRDSEEGLPGNVSEMWKVVGNKHENKELLKEYFPHE